MKTDDLTVTVLGSGTCVPSHTRYPASYFVRPFNWLLDIGPGALQRLSESGGSYREIDSVFISHAHPDHISGLLPLLQALNYTPGFTRSKPLFIYGPGEVERFVSVNLELAPSLRPAFPVHFTVLTDGKEVTGNNWFFVSREMSHSTDAQGIRFTSGGCTLVYGADTGPCSEIIELAHEADLLILECSFARNNPAPGHLTTYQVGEIARSAKVKILLLSHFYPEVSGMTEKEKEAEVRASGYDGNIIFAEDLLEVGVCSR